MIKNTILFALLSALLLVAQSQATEQKFNVNAQDTIEEFDQSKLDRIVADILHRIPLRRSNSIEGLSWSISADGNTLAVGDQYDNGNVGAAWIFTRLGNAWAQQGAKLIGAGAVGAAWQGFSVMLSADGNTLAVGGPDDNSGIGAVWIFTRSENTWTQQGAKLVGTGSIGIAHQGGSLSFFDDGNTLVVTSTQDNNDMAATWVFTRSSGEWTQHGSKRVHLGVFKFDVSTPKPNTKLEL